MGITIRVAGLNRNDRISCAVLLVEAYLVHVNVDSFFHVSLSVGDSVPRRLRLCNKA